jgi:hypothetical protein
MSEVEMTAHTVDRSGWGRGPWDREPEDRIEWRAHGLPCLMLRSARGNWCGYVAVPPGHSAHGQDYDNVDVEVHGGLTYSHACRGHICHVPQPGEPADVFWFGFDCAHGGDGVPFSYWPEPMRGEYRDVRYVRVQVNRLAEQLAAMAT